LYEKGQETERRVPFESKKMRLPMLQDKQTLYEGLSNFITHKNTPTIKKKPISRVRINDKSEEDEGIEG
jgi:hypothetical protein